MLLAFNYISQYNRSKVLKHKDNNNNSILYLMSRDKRIDYNFSIYLGNICNLKYDTNFYIVYNFDNSLQLKFQKFITECLIDIENKCNKLKIEFIIINQDFKENIKQIIDNYNIGIILVDNYPLNECKKINNYLINNTKCSIIMIDSNNLIPSWIISNKQEYNARTFRLKYDKQINNYPLDEIKIKQFKNNKFIKNKNIFKNIKIHSLFNGTFDSAIKHLNYFIKYKLHKYHNKNYIEYDATSNISPWLSNGIISSTRCIIEIKKYVDINKKLLNNYKLFYEEIIIRKELSDNFCYYNSNYKSLEECPLWAINSLLKHINDKRENIYSLKELEYFKTNNIYWNYCQKEMVENNYLNGYLRMYWCKCLLKWCNTPQEAINIAIYLNDKYFYDGRDPKGYVNILWCIGGLHDRAFKENKIFGKIRTMSDMNIKKKIKNFSL